MPLFVATPRLLNCAIYPIHCAKVDVRTPFRKGSKGRALAIHHFSQGCRRTHTAPPSFSRGTELQDHATVSVPRPSDAAPHSTPRSPPKSRAEYERTQTKDRRTNSFSTHRCAPHLHRGATESPRLWPRAAARVTPSAVARLPRACHPPLMDDGCSLCTVGPRRVGRWCLSPPGTASPDAVPQICGRPNPRPAKPLVQFLQQQEKFTPVSALTRISCYMRTRINRDELQAEPLLTIE